MTSASSSRQLELAARVLKALADPHRLRMMLRLAHAEMSVSLLTELEKEKITTTSARLKVLLTAGLLNRRRVGQTAVYSLADTHILNIIDNAIEYACEKVAYPKSYKEREEAIMTESLLNHPHRHGPGCGHTAIRHRDHVDYLHDGHLHYQNGDVVEEHVIEVSAKNPNCCTQEFWHEGHEAHHVHGPGCGHLAVPHGDHIDYLVDGTLHHPHGGHCDNHGLIEVL
ncbi:MAG TPA: metalloregulator ArsR/SmtB family transcription factor [Methylocella sp.]|nr:metalloregulator ArsR/SmtB family transcription factor [Methylocella sp.]